GTSKGGGDSGAHIRAMEHERKTMQNFFAGNSLDRLWQKRLDSAWIERQLAEPESRFIPIWETKNLVTEESQPTLVALTCNDLQDIIPDAQSIVLLGEINGRAYFAIGLPSNGSLPPASIGRLGRFGDLKSIGPLLDRRQASLLAYARAITYWHSRNRFCGVCGSATESVEAGHARVCTSHRCRQQQFPRTDPAIIVLITHQQSCLLGRQPIWPKGMFSTIAGFVEPGESLEEAVARETLEETGVRINEARYHSSQPWPFPSSIMLGFTAEADGPEIKIGDNELEDARWFTRAAIKEALRNKTMRLPTRISIAYRLIEDWYDAGASRRLKDLLNSL
ncbi:MAG: NAD(+) diphosphatase, partial [Desulforhabdus sp.]|nr:NAD(+) diphosphatase [Desulforhabdus sp.]